MLSTLAMYLPQFHRIPENDEWWGKGFTEWTAVRGAELLYEGHNQPRVPLNNNYYDLLEYDTMVWQAELMKKYRIDGICIYHYWFGNEKKVLERPAENLLSWKNISMPFCFCWANETWSRTWKRASYVNAWSSVYETKNDPLNNGILLKQIYGREDEWKKHFDYLLPFFKDDRYIKLNGKPVFVILNPSIILPLWSMLYYFNTMAKENSLPGIYVIGMTNKEIKELDAICARQPSNAMQAYHEKYKSVCQSPTIYSYDKIWEMILNQKIKTNKTYFCGLVDFDTSPRMGRKCHIMDEASPEKFYKYFKKLYQKSLSMNNEFIFVNAWNEWGESMYLEPDEKNGYGYLEALKRAIIESEEEFVKNEMVFDIFKETDLEKETRIMEEQINILCKHDTLLNNWICLKENNVDFSIFFEKYGYRNIAIYGMGKIGMHLLHELCMGDIRVSFGIDKNSENIKSKIEIYNPEQEMPKVDAVVITILNEYNEISSKLYKKMGCSMITIEEIVEELIADV